MNMDMNICIRWEQKFPCLLKISQYLISVKCEMDMEMNSLCMCWEWKYPCLFHILHYLSIVICERNMDMYSTLCYHDQISANVTHGCVGTVRIIFHRCYLKYLGPMAQSPVTSQYGWSNGSVPKKNASHVTNIVDIATKLPPLYSPYSQPSSKPNSISLAPIYQKLAYLSMFFICQYTLLTGTLRRLKNKQHS